MSNWLRVAITMVVVAWGANVYVPLLSLYRTTQGLSSVEVSFILFAYVIGIIPALLIGGPLSDRYGRRPLVVPAPIISAVGSLLMIVGADVTVLLVIGRIFSGVALGLGLAVAGSWLAELRPQGTARRAAMSLTAGFGLGAGVSGALGQWGPWPTGASYLTHIIVAAIALLLVLPVPETMRSEETGRLLAYMVVPEAEDPRFVGVVVPSAIWVFGCAASAYAVLPEVMIDHSGGLPIGFAAVICVVALGTGFAVEALGRRIDSPTSSRGTIVAMGAVILAMIVGAWASNRLTIPAALISSAALGAAYGLAMVSGLQEVQRLASPRHLAALTAVYYSIAYTGYAVPAILAVLGQTWPEVFGYPILFLGGAVIASFCLTMIIAAGQSRMAAPPVLRHRRTL
ncbi:MFS transporter [Millisia brevis]|uniref:MFS transporter n=1 Tax=Millisia brevis TaxID=264148 RepID=UPI000ABB8139